MLRVSAIILLLATFLSCNNEKKAAQKQMQIAFMADVHLQDIYGEFSDSDYKGILNPETGKYTLARTMQSQLQSTRLFNENYFAFLAALNDVVKRGVKYVVLPGDFSDDGQAINTRGLKDILENYSKKHNIEFILTTGNHDPVRPFYQDAGKHDFLGEDGKKQPIFSKAEIYSPKDSEALPLLLTKDIAKLGYVEILDELKDFGFYPKKTDVYWETPFSTYTYASYNFSEASNQSELDKRTYKISDYNSEIPDVSYLVEPGDDLWFLAIDANVYVPKESAELDALNPNNYNSASVGYNNVLTHKKYLLNWVKSVANRAEELGKTLIVFSHYPTIDFNDDASAEIKALFGDKKMQLHRVPEEAVAKAFADAGVKVHFGGHMHINDTGFRRFENESSLVNIQIPSLAAYIPAYKLLTIRNNDVFEIETMIIDSVPNFKSLFPLYQQEYDYLKKTEASTIWNKNILEVSNYKDYTQFHLKELVRLRFLKNDWPKAFKELLINSTGKKLLSFGFKDATSFVKYSQDLKEQNIDIERFNVWSGLDMINDFYKIKNADKLAFFDIDKKRLEDYKMVCRQLENSDNVQLVLWAKLFLKVCSGEPANHFQIDLKSNTIRPINDLY